jgi:hypothetical protein
VAISRSVVIASCSACEKCKTDIRNSEDRFPYLSKIVEWGDLYITEEENYEKVDNRNCIIRAGNDN